MRRLVVIHALLPNRKVTALVTMWGRGEGLGGCFTVFLVAWTSLLAVSSWFSEVVSVTGKFASLSGQRYCQSPEQVYTVAP